MTLSKRALSDVNWEYSLSFILDSTYNGIIAVDKDGYIVIFNDSAKKYFNLRRDITGLHIQEVVPESHLPTVLRSGKPELGKRMVLNNKICLENLTPIVKNNEIIGAVSVFEDISAVQGVMDELASVKDTGLILQNLLNNAHEGIVITDRHGHIEMCNEAFCACLKIDKGKVIGKDISSILTDLDLRSIIRTGEPELSETKQVKGLDVIITRIPVRNGNEVTGAIIKILFKNINEMDSLINKINTLKSKLTYYKEQLEKVSGAKYKVDHIIGKSQVIIQLKETIKKVAQGNSTVLLRGEAGTGKKLFANGLHLESPRKHGPFVVVDCAAVPGNMLEAELFGVAEGASSNTKKGSQTGKLELADGGTILLDEIGEMSIKLQERLLEVLQKKEIHRIGDHQVKTVDIRIVATTKRNLEDLTRQKLFREDLYYRLNVLSFYIPPLRDRREDIEPLINFFIDKFNNEFGKKVIGISSEAYNILIKHTWPGNVRELETVMERVFSVVEDQIIQPHHLPIYLKKISHTKFKINDIASLKTIIEDTERNALIQALQRTGGNKVKAAKLLGISRAGLYQKLEKYNLLDD
ncbi:MAG: sigma-54-dependent Fis family transcriptional regulator [Firmicutes bacterium HGW-Firmicutes-14]|nr:MAG: sigma-54-dependent Fis family transcriptional regulator [Firmicutes bacterium HGW-Firmicutes-14]